ncbi:MAG: hypothetical protein AAFX03_00505 [Pseudomonadota bacterium]
MAIHRRASAQSSGWIQSVVFNGLLLLIPLLAAQTLASALSGDGMGPEPTPVALAETRREIERSFERLAPRAADPRAFWADLVDRELNARDMSAARGFLLAAPIMLNSEDSRAVKAAAEIEPSGSADQRMARAALIFLPNDVRARYDAANRPPEVEIAAEEPVESAPSEADAETQSAVLEQAEATRRRFMLLGTPDDLAANTRAWKMGAETDTLLLRLNGIAMNADQVGGAAGRALAASAPQAVSILKAARRSGRLHPAYAQQLAQRVEAAMPEARLRAALDNAFDPSAPPSGQADRVSAAFLEALDVDALPRLKVELRHVAEISEATSAAGAVTLIEQVRGAGEMRKARLIAEAGGDRAIALVKQNGRGALSAADTGVRWTQMLVLQIMGLVAALMALILTTLSTLTRTFSPRPSVARLI